MSLIWMTYADPASLVNVGMEAIAMYGDNTVTFINLATHEKLYFSATQMKGLGISLLAGHNRFELFAFAEAILRPRIFIMKYPEFTIHSVFNSDMIPTYLDLRFSDFDNLVALSGYPYYKFRIWNFRTGHLLIEHDTTEKCSRFSVLLSGNNSPVIVQYSKLLKTIRVWEMCFTEERYYLHGISKILLPSEHTESDLFAIAFSDDGNLYVVDDFGVVSIVVIAQFYLDFVWSAGLKEKPRRYRLFPHKQGLLVCNSETVYYIKRKASAWAIEWVLDNPDNIIKKIISNFNTEVFAADDFGNTFQVQVDPGVESAKLVVLNQTNFRVLDFAVLRGIKEDAFVILTDSGELRMVDLHHLRTFSMVKIEGALNVVPHSTWSCVAISTSTCKVHFLAYEKVRQEPVTLAVIDLETIVLRAVRLFDTTMFAQDTDDSFHTFRADFKSKQFQYLSVIEPAAANKKVSVMNFFLLENFRAIAFIAQDMEGFRPYVNELWIYNWSFNVSTDVEKCIIDLPYKYCFINQNVAKSGDSVEFTAARLNSVYFDMFTLNRQSILTLSCSIRTSHISNLHGLAGVRDIITWGAAGMIFHFKSHKKSNKMYAMARQLRTFYAPRIMARTEDCFNSKYFLNLYVDGKLKGHIYSNMQENLREKTPRDYITDVRVYTPRETTTFAIKMKDTEGQIVVVLTPEAFALKAKVVERLKALAVELTALINFDMSVTGKTKGVFRKFCLNSRWLDRLEEEARRLFDMERAIMNSAITEQARIRDYIKSLINFSTRSVSIKIRALFSYVTFENFSLSLATDEQYRRLDYYQFYNMDPLDDEYGAEELEDGPESREPIEKKGTFFKMQGDNIYNHIMSPEYAIQDIDMVTANLMFARNSTYKYTHSSQLRKEFNKMFDELRLYKQEMMDSIFNTNAVLLKIYKNMNCMLCLLKKPPFPTPELTVPEWTKDELIERIMEVDDSEIKAVNRRKKKQEVTDGKRGRMLLWSIEFWIRALITMMDGVLEKLWEEEIKKEIPLPEFMTKKQLHEYTLEDQRQLRDYEQKVLVLAADRRKYLRILSKNEAKTMNLKTGLIEKLNESCGRTAIAKLQYDFALRVGRLRLLNVKIRHMKRVNLRELVHKLQTKDSKLLTYIERFGKLVDFYEKSVIDIQVRLEQLHIREKAIDRQFRGSFLTSIPANLINEMLKLFKHRPKVTQKSFNSTLVCLEAAIRLASKHPRALFPLPNEVLEFLSMVDSLDDPQLNPHHLDAKHWENFIKLRRQKIESELKIKGTILQQVETQNAINWFLKQMSNMKTAHMDLETTIKETLDQYHNVVHNQYLQITLTMGQVEVAFDGSIQRLKNSILMNYDDVNDINELIKKAGAKKLKAMERVAFFRRQVIFKEWEHRVVRANIEYLKYMLQVIEKCKVTMEFLQILRNWKKVKENRDMSSSVGLLERVVAEKVAAYRKHLDRIIDKIDKVKAEIQAMKTLNQQRNHEIDELKVGVVISNINRDYMFEEKRTREQNERMVKIKAHSCLIETVRRDYATILELKTILELQRLRTYPTLGPAPQCPPHEMYM